MAKANSNVCLGHSPHRLQVYLLPLEGVRGVKLVTYSDVINIGLPIGEGWGGS